MHLPGSQARTKPAVKLTGLAVYQVGRFSLGCGQGLAAVNAVGLIKASLPPAEGAFDCRGVVQEEVCYEAGQVEGADYDEPENQPGR